MARVSRERNPNTMVKTFQLNLRRGFCWPGCWAARSESFRRAASFSDGGRSSKRVVWLMLCWGRVLVWAVDTTLLKLEGINRILIRAGTSRRGLLLARRTSRGEMKVGGLYRPYLRRVTTEILLMIGAALTKRHLLIPGTRSSLEGVSRWIRPAVV